MKPLRQSRWTFPKQAASSQITVSTSRIGKPLSKDRIDWQTDLPPDLVIEINVTTYTAAEDCLPYRVLEVWLFKKTLKIYALQGEAYQLQPFSRYFPEVDLPELVSRVLQTASEQGTGAALRELHQRLIK